MKVVSQELDKAIGDKATSPLAGILRIIPLERLNALLIVTPQPAYLDEVKKWIVRLDQAGTGDGPSFFVYNLQNQRAEKLGPLLTQAFTGRAPPAAAPSAPTLAPGTPAGTIVNPPTFQAQPAVVQPTINVTTTQSQPVTQNQQQNAGGRSGEGLGIVRNIQVVADKDNNTLLIVATAQEYRIIEAALRKLDIPPRQVTMEVTIAIGHADRRARLRHRLAVQGRRAVGTRLRRQRQRDRNTPINPAVRWPRRSPRPRRRRRSTRRSALAQGFYYIINNANFPGGVQAALHLLDTYGDTKVIANPHLAALDNQKATIKAGDKIPINQQSIVGSTTNVVTTTSQYIDTGVLMQVTPHINQGGLVTLDVQVEVSNPGRRAPVGERPRSTRDRSRRWSMCSPARRW